MSKQQDDRKSVNMELLNKQANHNAGGTVRKSGGKKSKKRQCIYPFFYGGHDAEWAWIADNRGGQRTACPGLLRIRDLAFLPNQVRANLKGCFVISERSWIFADERAHLRITSISCLSKKEQR